MTLRKPTLKKLTLALIFLALTVGLAVGLPASAPQTVAAQEDEKTFIPLFTNSREPLYSTSYYMITVDPAFTYDLGCELGSRDQGAPGTQDSVVVLDFSYPVCNADESYGAELFGFGPVPLTEIETAARSFAEGYYQCTGSDNDSNLVLGIGTNNKPTSCDSTAKLTAHGAAWAEMVNQVNQSLLASNMLQQVQAYGASDIELGWNSPTQSKAWLTGYGSLADAPLIHFGDAAGCPYEDRPTLDCGTSAFPEWTSEDVWYVSWGFPPSLPLPLIYLTSGVHAQQWAFLSQYAVANHGARMDFTGVFTQSQACEQWGCTTTDNTPSEAYWQLYNELNKYPETAQELDWKTDIRWILREEAYPEIYGAGSAVAYALPESLDDLLTELSTTVQSPETSREAEDLLAGKLTLLTGLAEKMQAAAANPAPKGQGYVGLPAGTGETTFIEGILPGGAIAGLPYGATITTVWQTRTDIGYLQIAAGASPDHPGQGALFIQHTAWDKASASSHLVLTAEESGSLTILESTPNGLLLQSETGAQYSYALGSARLILIP